jgi:hypothetical protein
MPVFLYKFRNVRSPHSTEVNGNASDAVNSIEYTFHHEGTIAPTAEQAKVVLDKFIDSMGYVGPERPNISAKMAEGHALSADRTNPSKGAASFRVGKAFYQYGVAYHSSTLNGAMAATTTWKNLS